MRVIFSNIMDEWIEEAKTALAQYTCLPPDMQREQVIGCIQYWEAVISGFEWGQLRLKREKADPLAPVPVIDRPPETPADGPHG